MAASKKGKKPYVPKPVIRNPLTFLLNKRLPLPQEEKYRLGCRYHAALAALTSGTATRHDWQMVADMLNLTNVVATKYGLGAEHLPSIIEAQRAHNECGIRRLEKGAFGYTGAQLRVVNVAADMHDQMLELVTVEQYYLAESEVERRIGLGLCAFSPRKDYATRAAALQQQGICAVSPT